MTRTIAHAGWARALLANALLVAVAATLALGASNSYAVNTPIPYGDSHAYKIVGHGEEPLFHLETYDDDSWARGSAPFSDGCGDVPPGETAWPLDTDLLTREHFPLPAGATNVRVSVAIDNDVQVWVNGIDISGGVRHHDGCAARDTFVFDVPPGVYRTLPTGVNLLAVRAADFGIVNYFDVQVSYDNPDTDGDGVPNVSDNCPDNANQDQKNTDSDGQGDVCDPDDDNDGIGDGGDNCPVNPNADQKNTDGDAQGDVCDSDDDGDGVGDSGDNCPLAKNGDQRNTDGDAQGDVCDPDDDNDGRADGIDNCPVTSNGDQKNTDGDAQGDACDPDDDNDGRADTSDNCPTKANPDQRDSDFDGTGDACDATPVPASTPACKLTGAGGITLGNGDRATFEGVAHANGLKGNESYTDRGPVTPISVSSIELRAVTCNPARTEGSVYGRARVNGGGTHDFAIGVKDLGEPGRNDTYRIRLSNGYDSGERKVTNGNIQVHK